MQENPELPVIPIVDGEIPGDDSDRWLGAWGNARIDEYLLKTHDAGWMIFKSDDDVFDVLEAYLPEEKLRNLPETKEECKPYYDALPWMKAIIVNIDPPEELR